MSLNRTLAKQGKKLQINGLFLGIIGLAGGLRRIALPTNTNRICDGHDCPNLYNLAPFTSKYAREASAIIRVVGTLYSLFTTNFIWVK